MDDISIRPLRDLRLSDAAQVGGKAANLGQLFSMGVAVPDGIVLTNCGSSLTAPSREVVEAAVQNLGDGPFVVRSSGVAEDGVERSFAGMFTSVLDVLPKDMTEAVDRVLASANTERVSGYDGSADASATSMAVVIQQMIQPIASGVALTADPVTGNRSLCLVTAVRGTAERLVSGEAMGDEWIVEDDGSPQERRPDEGAITSDQVKQVALAARQIEQGHGIPQDIEWAIDADGVLWIVQARPMTALPAEASWDPPAPGAYSRTFRLGEWISGPVTPLFESWLLPVIEEELHSTLQNWTGLRSPEPHHVVVNGWTFFSLNWLSPATSLRSMPGILWRAIRTPAPCRRGET